MNFDDTTTCEEKILKLFKEAFFIFRPENLFSSIMRNERCTIRVECNFEISLCYFAFLFVTRCEGWLVVDPINILLCQCIKWNEDFIL